MAQRLIKNLSSIQTEDFIAKTGILAELVVELHAVEQEENQSIIVNECYVLSEGAEAKEGESSECLASEEVQRVAKNFGVFLRGVSVKYQKELSGVFDKGIGISLRNVTYHVFSTICSNVLRRTFNGVANRWDQTLLVFANYMQLREALQGNSLHQNEMASYIGRYLGEMGFQSWISWIQHQDDWQHLGQIRPGTHDPPICPPEGSPV